MPYHSIFCIWSFKGIEKLFKTLFLSPLSIQVLLVVLNIVNTVEMFKISLYFSAATVALYPGLPMFFNVPVSTIEWRSTWKNIGYEAIATSVIPLKVSNCNHSISSLVHFLEGNHDDILTWLTHRRLQTIIYNCASPPINIVWLFRIAWNLKSILNVVASSPDPFPAFQCWTLKSSEKLGMGLGTRLEYWIL